MESKYYGFEMLTHAIDRVTSQNNLSFLSKIMI